MKKMIEELRTTLEEGGFLDKAKSYVKAGLHAKDALKASGGLKPIYPLSNIGLPRKPVDGLKNAAKALLHGDVGKAKKAVVGAKDDFVAGAKPALKAAAYAKGGNVAGDKVSSILGK